VTFRTLFFFRKRKRELARLSEKVQNQPRPRKKLFNRKTRKKKRLVGTTKKKEATPRLLWIAFLLLAVLIHSFPERHKRRLLLRERGFLIRHRNVLLFNKDDDDDAGDEFRAGRTTTPRFEYHYCEE